MKGHLGLFVGMSFLSLMLSETDKIKFIIFDHLYVFYEIEEFLEKDDVKLFCEKSFDGTLYEWISENTGLSREDSKLFMFYFKKSDIYLRHTFHYLSYCMMHMMNEGSSQDKQQEV